MLSSLFSRRRIVALFVTSLLSCKAIKCSLFVPWINSVVQERSNFYMCSRALRRLVNGYRIDKGTKHKLYSLCKHFFCYMCQTIHYFIIQYASNLLIFIWNASQSMKKKLGKSLLWSKRDASHRLSNEKLIKFYK